MTVSAELLAILRCPVDGGALSEEDDFLECRSCGQRYPVVDGMPVMMPPRKRVQPGPASIQRAVE